MADGILKVGEITTSSGSGNITIGSGVTLQNNVPAFFAFKDSSSNVTDSAFTTAVCNVETLDTDNGYNTSTGKYTVPTAGKYSVSFGVFGKADGNSRAERIIGRIVRERSGASDFYIGYADTDFRANDGRGSGLNSTTCYEFNVGDVIYPQIYVQVNAGTPSVIGETNYYYTYIGAYRIGA
jgi:hypothetical protein